jgi:hypothetical protein
MRITLCIQGEWSSTTLKLCLQSATLHPHEVCSGEDPQVIWPDEISVRHPNVYGTRLGSDDHWATGLRHLALDGQGELLHLPGRGA